MDPYYDPPGLREHVRRFLHDYVKLHITKDYVRYTEEVVSQVTPVELSSIDTRSWFSTANFGPR
jgi:hypothetical protein